jgi:hypothetical protein
MAVPTTSTARGASKPVARSRKRSKSATMIDPQRRRALIAEAAYLRSERRGFAPGHEEEDWLAAEAEIDTALTAGAHKAVQ